MWQKLLMGFSATAVSLAALMLGPGTVMAQHRGGGGHGGGHAGVSHSSSGWHGGSNWHGGGSNWHGGSGWRGGNWGGFRGGVFLGLGGLGYYGGYPYYGWGNRYGGYYPYSYGYSSYGYSYPTYSYPYYDYGYSSPYYGTTAVVPNTQYSYGYPTDVSPNFTTVTTTTAQVVVRVPDPSAQVWIGNYPSSQTGTVRTFESPPLDPGQTYSYDIRAQWNGGGQPINLVRHIDVRAGATAVVDFSQPY